MIEPSQATWLRYGSRDLLGLTAFVAVYLTAFVRPAYRHGEDLGGELFALAVVTFTGWAALSYLRRASNRDAPDGAVKLPANVPWTLLVTLALIDLAVSSLLLSGDQEIGVSGLTLAITMAFLTCRDVVADPRGVTLSFARWPWSNVLAIRGPADELYALALGSRWSGLRVAVPAASRERIEAYLAGRQ